MPARNRYACIGEVEMVSSGGKAMLFKLRDQDGKPRVWIPYSLMSSACAASLDLNDRGKTYARFQVELWFIEKKELEVRQ